MLLQTNSYIVPKDKRAEHARLLQRFRQTLIRLGCEHFEVYEQVGANWAGNETTGRFVQLMKFKDRRQQQQVQGAERTDPTAQALIKEFCELINFPYQQQQGLFAVGFYQSVVPAVAGVKPPEQETASPEAPASSPPTPMPPEEIHPPDVHGEQVAGEEVAGESPTDPTATHDPGSNGSAIEEIAELPAEDQNIPDPLPDPIEADQSH